MKITKPNGEVIECTVDEYREMSNNKVVIEEVVVKGNRLPKKVEDFNFGHLIPSVFASPTVPLPKTKIKLTDLEPKRPYRKVKAINRFRAFSPTEVKTIWDAYQHSQTISVAGGKRQKYMKKLAKELGRSLFAINTAVSRIKKGTLRFNKGKLIKVDKDGFFQDVKKEKKKLSFNAKYLNVREAKGLPPKKKNRDYSKNSARAKFVFTKMNEILKADPNVSKPIAMKLACDAYKQQQNKNIMTELIGEPI